MSQEVGKKRADGELDDEQLESVAGGAFGPAQNDNKCPKCGGVTNGIVAHQCPGEGLFGSLPGSTTNG